jgi:hypothetical protein
VGVTKSKPNPLHLFPKFYLFIFLKILDFMICNDALNKYVVGKE